MDSLTNELERMATNIAAYTGPESEIPLDDINGDGGLPPTTPQDPSPRPAARPGLPRPKARNLNNTTYLVKLGGPLPTATSIQTTAGLPTAPPVISGTNDADEPASFCRLPRAAVAELEAWLADAGVPPTERPAFLRLSQAAKELSPGSAHPTLGVDATLPQHRAESARCVFAPRQDEWPVWYFFYGTLGEPGRLTSLLGLAEGEEAVLERAAVRDGRLRTWGGRYKALVDGEGRVEGWAYRVRSAEQEDALRAYETEKYEVVRCKIEIESWEEDVWGCTFRFVDPSELD
ncbi:hypothetical protein SLS57_009570 [Botryosphaeria dothidea]